MKGKTTQASIRSLVWLAVALSMCIALLVASGPGGRAQAQGTNAGAAPAGGPVCPGGQCFTDIPPSNTFFANVNALYQDEIITGYTCGGPGEPCDTDNRPYYRPGNLVSRQQMSKFVDLGRRNIAEAIGVSLVMTNPNGPSLVLSNTTTDGIRIRNASGAEAIQSNCVTPDSNCYAVYGVAAPGTRPGVFSGGYGLYATNSDDTYPGIQAYTISPNSYGGELLSENHRGGLAKSSSNGRFSMYVEAQDGPSQGTAALNVYGPGRVEGIFYALGGCSGCFLSNIVQNVDGTALQPGDVVAVVGTIDAVEGDTPILTVKKANSQYDTGVVGIIDQAMYVPDAATKAAYDQQERDISEARDQRANSMAASPEGDKANVQVPSATITDEQGTIHALPGTNRIETNGYGSIVTQGVYKAIKVDAGFGSIQAGDLLTTSPNPGYAMKVTDKLAATGAIIGKAMGDLQEGTGTIPVLVTLK